MKRDLELDLLRTFVAVAAHRNFTQAGQAVGRTQSAISLQVKRLEEIVGKPLFVRTRQSVSITQTGETLLVYAKRIITANDAALSHIQQPDAEGLVRIGTPDDYAAYLLPALLSQIALEHPRVRIEVTCENSCDLLRMLEQEQLDVVIGTHKSNAVAGQIARYEPIHWVASPQYIDDPETSLSLVLFPSGCVCRDIALDALKQINRSWNISYSTRSVGLMEKAMIKDKCVSVMEASIIPSTLKIIDGQTDLPPLPDVVISVHTSNTNKAHVSLVAQSLLAKLGSVPMKQAS